MLMDWNDLDMTPYTNIAKYTMEAQQKISNFVNNSERFASAWIGCWRRSAFGNKKDRTHESG